MREFTALGVGDELLRAGIENVESCFFNRFGQLIYKEPRGKFAGYQFPEVGIHRGKLHLILFGSILTGKIVIYPIVDDIDDFITQEELRALPEGYKRIAGFSLSDVGASGPLA